MGTFLGKSIAVLGVTRVTYGRVKLHLVQIVQGQLEELQQLGGDLLRDRVQVREQG